MYIHRVKHRCMVCIFRLRWDICRDPIDMCKEKTDTCTSDTEWNCHYAVLYASGSQVGAGARCREPSIGGRRCGPPNGWLPKALCEMFLYRNAWKSHFWGVRCEVLQDDWGASDPSDADVHKARAIHEGVRVEGDWYGIESGPRFWPGLEGGMIYAPYFLMKLLRVQIMY